MAVCRLCLRECSRLVESHIIPRTLLTEPENPGALLAIISPEGVAKSLTGEYVRLFCEECERSFSSCDAQFVRFVRNIDAGEALFDSRNGELLGRHYREGFSPTLLRRFGQTLLFRAHLSERRFFRAVHVGSHFDDLRSTVLDGGAGTPDGFAVVLVTVGGTLASTVIGPVRVRLDGIHCYRFHIRGVSIFVKVDRQSFRPLARTYQLDESQPLIALHNKDLHPSTHKSLGGILGAHATQIDRLLMNRTGTTSPGEKIQR